jgi:alkanesulfonate monooxygenase SsuD/methylene tetrahydromethanopterin reductase-like flavin-dependent oxidoreductase (luciferase family)
MRIGMFYQIQIPKAWTAESETQRYWEMLEQVEYAEETGFESVWLVEHHFSAEWSHSSAPDVTLGALSQRTSRMRLGIAMALPPLHHSLHTAVRLATLDILSRGRMEQGVGRSGYPYQMVPFGIDLADASGTVQETLEIIPVPRPRTRSHTMAAISGFPRQVIPKPVQRPHPPLWQACTQEETFRKAGQQGLGCITQASVGPQRTEGSPRSTEMPSVPLYQSQSS